MQTTLLGIAIVIILALVAALVGPHFVDWNQYRGEFETQASRLTGLEVRIAGPIEARILPTPALTLKRIEITRPGDAGVLRARSLSLEFALGALVRGEWRASEVHLEGPDVALGLDPSGRMEWPARLTGVDLDMISIERLEVVDGRATFTDAASGARLVLDKLEFKGELRTLAGPVKGEGAFVVAGQHYPYRLAASRAGGDGGVRVRLNVDPIDRPLIADIDAFVFVEHGVPRFEGNFQLARPVGRAPDGIIEPWRVASRVKGDSTAAVFEQIEFQYGPDDRGIKLRGDANLALGAAPQLAIGLTAAQIDLDRMLNLPDAMRRRPLAAIRSMADYFGGAQRLPLPVRLGISVENAMLAGAMLQRVSGEIRADADSWDVEVLEFRAPGATQVRLSGRLDVGGKGLAFSGPARVDARDSRALVSWLTDRDAQGLASGSLRAQGDLKLGNETIAVDGLKADLDRVTLEGRLAYSWPNGDVPPRMEAALDAPELDLDRSYALVQGLFADAAFAWPREGAFAVKVGRASVAGIEAKRTDIAMRFDRQGLDIERLAVGDLGGAAVSVKGRIDTRTSTPRGSLTLDLDASKVDGVATLMEKFAPSAAAELRRGATRFVPAKLRATLSIDADPARPAGSPALAGLKIEGSAGIFRINLQGRSDSTGDTSVIANLMRLGGAKTNLSGRLDAGDGSVLVELLGLDPFVAVDKRPAQLSLTASGPFDGEMTVEGQLVAGGLDVSTQGTLRLAGKEGPVAGLAVKVASASLRSPRPAGAGGKVETLTTALSGRLALAEGSVVLSDLGGTVAGADVSGRLKVGLNAGLAQPVTVDGDIDLGEINLPAAIATTVGTPVQGPGQGASAAATWPAEPFEQGLLGRLSGRIALKSAYVSLTPRLAAKKVRVVARFDQSRLTLEEIDGTLAGGRVAGDMSFERRADGVTARSHLRVAGADLTELIRGGPPPLSGRLTINVDMEGTGRSPVAVIGSLDGSGTFMLQDGRMLRLDPGAFEAVIRSADQGLPIDAARIRDRMEQALGAGEIAIPLAEGTIVVAGGQAQLGNVVVRSEGADLAIGGSVALADDLIDAKLTLSGPVRADAPGGTRPEINVTLKGPVNSPRRALDAAAFTNWLAVRAVEQQTKRIDALESGREVPSGTSVPQPPVTGTTPPSGGPAVTVPRRVVRPQAETPLRPRATAQPTAPATRQAPMDIRPPAR